MKERIIFLMGPTAAGKTEAAACLAKKLNAEIISCDSMQIYKNMDIVTSMPAPSLRKRIPHHLVDCIKPDREYNVARYRREALAAVKKIIRKKKTPLFVGGTGHYMSMLIDGIFKGDSEDKRIRLRLYEEAKELGSRYLHCKLAEIDPIAAAKIHPNDAKRIIRALEVFEIEGRPISELQKERKGLSDKYDVKIFCLNMRRDKLYARIDERIEKMFRKGLMPEVKRLLKSRLSKTASCAIGIKELKSYLEGAVDLEEAKRLMKRNTRRYAKRQLSWFRRDKRITWVEISEDERPGEIAKRIYKWNAPY